MLIKVQGNKSRVSQEYTRLIGNHQWRYGGGQERGQVVSNSEYSPPKRGINMITGDHEKEPLGGVSNPVSKMERRWAKGEEEEIYSFRRTAFSALARLGVRPQHARHPVSTWGHTAHRERAT